MTDPIREEHARFDAKWEPCPTTGCYLWTAPDNGNGYGRISISGRNVYAHRYAYERWVGAIPEDLVVDHICNNRACVNPDHLRVTTNRKNVLRGIGTSAVNARKVECFRGHEFTDDNTYISPDGQRHCKACRRLTGRKYYWSDRDKQIQRMRLRRLSNG